MTDNKGFTLRAATLITVGVCIAVGFITQAGADLFKEVIEGVTAPFLPGF